MPRNYDELLQLTIDLQAYNGYLDTQGLKERNQIEMRFRGARDRFVYALLKEGDSPDELAAMVTADLAAIDAPPGSPLAVAADEVREELLNRIERESRKSPLHRTIIRWTPAAIGVALVIAYFSVRLASGIPIDQPIDTREGLRQRAAAAQKVLRYDDWAAGRSGLIKEILIWPIAPTEAETQGAIEFANVVLGRHARLLATGQICGQPQFASETGLSKAQLELIAKSADHIAKAEVTWQDPPAATVEVPIRAAYLCESRAE